jgi:hypothetical protein
LKKLYWAIRPANNEYGDCRRDEDFPGRKSFNFRQGEFAAKNARFNFKEQLKWAAVVAGIIFLLAIVNQFLDYSLQTQHLNNIKKQIAHIFKNRFPEAKP